MECMVCKLPFLDGDEISESDSGTVVCISCEENLEHYMMAHVFYEQGGVDGDG